MKRIVLSAFLILGMAVPLASPAHAVFGLGCSDAQKTVPALARKMASSASAEMTYYKRADYKSAYSRYAQTTKTYKQWYDLVQKKRKCFNGDSSISSTIKTMHENYYQQVSMCDRYGIEICRIYIKPSYGPCDDYKYDAFRYESCMEDQARDYGGGYVD